MSDNESQTSTVTEPEAAATAETSPAETSRSETTAPETSPSDSAPAGRTAPAAGERNYRKTRQGYVVSDKMDKTVVVEVEDRVKHALYGKVIRRTSKVKAHDEANEVGIGDRVLIMETRPLSATKRWRVVEILEKAK